jgi:predicted nucleic acid-binding protein
MDTLWSPPAGGSSAAQHPHAFVTDVEVVQELLHHYRRHWPVGKTAIEDFMLLMTGRIASIDPVDVRATITLADQYTHLSARDLLHLAVIRRLGVSAIASADTDYDQVLDLSRLDPDQLASWERRIPSRGVGTP